MAYEKGKEDPAQWAGTHLACRHYISAGLSDVPYTSAHMHARRVIFTYTYWFIFPARSLSSHWIISSRGSIFVPHERLRRIQRVPQSPWGCFASLTHSVDAVCYTCWSLLLRAHVSICHHRGQSISQIPAFLQVSKCPETCYFLQPRSLPKCIDQLSSNYRLQARMEFSKINNLLISSSQWMLLKFFYINISWYFSNE